MNQCSLEKVGGEFINSSKTLVPKLFMKKSLSLLEELNRREVWLGKYWKNIKPADCNSMDKEAGRQ